jgi:MFS family permease
LATNFLDRSRSIAGPGFNRWLVPPAALCIHLCIGEVYAFSVFNKPLSQAIGITAPVPGSDWTIPDLGWIFSVAIAVLGISSALFGRWMERVGPRMAMFYAAIAFAAGFFVSAIGVQVHQLWLVYLGYGVIGGWGLGVGYISPVSTLIKWFPDRPGLATGTAIMGFGGAALIASPLSVLLMKYFGSATSVGVAPTFVVLGVLYLIWMMVGSQIVRVPPDGWRPAGWTPVNTEGKMITTHQVVRAQAVRTPQFWLLWLVLFFNVTAGIAVLGQASLMAQDVLGVTAAAAAGFVGLLSLFNMGGRIFWASMSDYIGRKGTYVIFFVVGAILYALTPTLGQLHNIALFVLAYCIVLTFYGGGFATIPAYLRDLFGTVEVGAIHGVLLTAWSAAGVVGPVLINYIRAFELSHGVAKNDAYGVTMYVMAVLLVLGLICDLLVRPVSQRFWVRGTASATA